MGLVLLYSESIWVSELNTQEGRVAALMPSGSVAFISETIRR